MKVLKLIHNNKYAIVEIEQTDVDNPKPYDCIKIIPIEEYNFKYYEYDKEHYIVTGNIITSILFQ